MSNLSKEKIYAMLDGMVIRLNEEKSRLSKSVQTGQLKNDERHKQFNQFYIKTLSTMTEDIASTQSKQRQSTNLTTGSIGE